MSGLLEPLTPVDCDCRGLPYMPLEIVRLGDSDLVALSTGDEFKAAVMLWAKAWQQVPAASLPDDDRILARMAGCALADWRILREMALRGWVKCSDGRLYHPLIADLAIKVSAKRRGQAERANSRWAKAKAAQKAANDAPAVPRHPEPDATASETPCPGNARDRDSNIPPGRTPSVPPEEPSKEAWRRGVRLLKASGGLTDTKARNLFGKLLSQTGLSASDLLPSIVKAETNGTQDPQAYLTKAAQLLAQRRPDKPNGADVSAWNDSHWENAMRIWRDEGHWDPETMGPEPGKPGCIVPPRHLVGAVA